MFQRSKDQNEQLSIIDEIAGRSGEPSDLLRRGYLTPAQDPAAAKLFQRWVQGDDLGMPGNWAPQSVSLAGGSQTAALPGGGVRGFQTGAYLPAQPGGVPFIGAEGGSDEIVLPLTHDVLHDLGVSIVQANYGQRTEIAPTPTAPPALHGTHIDRLEVNMLTVPMTASEAAQEIAWQLSRV
jgi:hypothetical protein